MSEQPKKFVPFTVSVDTEQEAAALLRILDAANRYGMTQPGNSLNNSADVMAVAVKFNGASQIANAAVASVAKARDKSARNGKRH